MIRRLLDTRSLFQRTARVFLATLLLVQLFSLLISAYFVFLPMLRNSVDDFAALIALSVDRYLDLPVDARETFLQSLKQRHRLTIQPSEGPEPGARSYLPYVRLLEARLSRDLGQRVRVESSAAGPRRYWIDLNRHDRWWRVGFTHARIGTHPPLTIALLLALGVGISVVVTLLVTRRLTAPLDAMGEATLQVGQGALPAPLPESGPRELATLARNFNRMAVRVRELLSTRTTLLAGISHDLRTPMARIRLQIELLRGEADDKRLDGIERDLEEMDALITQLLDIAREVSSQSVEPTSVAALIDAVAADFHRAGADLRLEIAQDFTLSLNAMAFKRVLGNFIENGLKHGRPPLQIRLGGDNDQINVEVLDQGSGPDKADSEHLFEPFAQGVGASGSGLGLAIVRGIAHTYGWQVSLARGPHGGGVARLTIPR